jgi:caspase 7
MASENAVSQSIYQNEQFLINSNEININELTDRFQMSRQGRFADESEYQMNHIKRGTAVIINNKIFDSRLQMPTRDGTDKDAASLEFCFRKLGFEIRLFHNCAAFLMRDLLLKYAKADHSDSDCFVCVLMSHGENGVIYGVDQEIEIERLIDPFKSNRTLAGKPKLFFIQACRGTHLMEGIDSNPFEVNYVSKIPMEADFLIAYSTIAGYYSWRNSLNGSWFIQSLCNILNECGDALEIMQLLTAVNRRVAYYYESNTSDPYMHGKKQVPCIVSMLTKELYFRPKKNYNTFSNLISVKYSKN